MVFFVVSSHEPPIHIRGLTLSREGIIGIPVMDFARFGGFDSIVEVIKSAQIPERWLDS